MDKLLYFPSITIPKSQWLMGALFYWDKVGSIVPLEYLERPSKLNGHMRDLVHAGMIEQVVPEIYLGSVQNYEKAFLDFIDNDTTIKHISELGKLGLIGNKGIIKSTTPIHMGKLNDIGEELRNRGLATRKQGSWYHVESHTASTFMTYLATILGSITQYTPITDNYNDLTNYLPLTNEKDKRIALKEQLRARIIEKILPVPLSIDDPYDIYRFKEKYYDNLKRFRNYIEEFILELELSPDYQTEDKIKLFIETSLDETNYIKDKMQTFKWSSIGLATICSVAPPAISLTNGFAGNSLIETTGNAISLLGAVGVALSSEKSHVINHKPLAYAAIIEREFNSQSYRRNRIGTKFT